MTKSLIRLLALVVVVFVAAPQVFALDDPPSCSNSCGGTSEGSSGMCQIFRTSIGGNCNGNEGGFVFESSAQGDCDQAGGKLDCGGYEQEFFGCPGIGCCWVAHNQCLCKYPSCM